jgi:ABC-type Fe3+-hydroxamate transport system substrate-binding protein
MKNVCGVTYADRIQLENLQAQIANGETQNLTSNGDVNMEELLLLNPSVLFSVPFESTPYQSKLPQCTVIPTTEYLEEHPLGKAEWLYVFGYVLRKEEMASALFEVIESAYLDAMQDSSKDSAKDSTKDSTKDSAKDSTKDSAKDSTKDSTKDSSKDVSQEPSVNPCATSCGASCATSCKASCATSCKASCATSCKASRPRPKVFFAANNGSDWTVANNQSYWAILLKDAGAEYVGATDDEGNLNFDKERMLFALNEADVYGELVYFPNTSNVSLSQLHPEFTQSGPFQHKKLFLCNAADNGFFDKALLEPHILLQELKKVLSDSTFSGNYFQRIQ